MAASSSNASTVNDRAEWLYLARTEAEHARRIRATANAHYRSVADAPGYLGRIHSRLSRAASAIAAAQQGIPFSTEGLQWFYAFETEHFGARRGEK